MVSLSRSMCEQMTEKNVELIPDTIRGFYIKGYGENAEKILVY
jgi:hypothetical protein